MFLNLDIYQSIFWFCALLGSGFFVLNTLASFFSGIDTGVDIASHQVSHEGVGGTDSAFQLISLTSLTGFIMMFGWMGLASYDQMNLGVALALPIALISGAATMYITAWIFRSAKRLTSPGSVFDVHQTIGKTATVYAKIPAHGKGQIQIVVADLTHEIDALSEDHSEIESTSSVTVVAVIDQSTVIVKPIN